MKKALILSCSTGQGHNSCARAVKEYFDRQQVDCTVADAFRFVSEKFARFMGEGHSFMYRHIPGLFCWGYGYSKKHPALFKEKTLIYKILTAGTLRMYQYIAKEKFDTVICTHVLSAIMLTHMQKTLPLALKTAMVMTDYTCYPGMKATDLQRYFIPDGFLAEEFVKCGIPREKISVAGIPVCQEFYKKIEKTDAKRLLNIQAEHRHLLVMCGSMGCGPIAMMVEHLYKNLPEDTEVSVICGTNERLQKKLDRKYQDADQIHVAGYTKQMSLYMDSADLCLMKPGGLSVTEAAVKKLPMAFINAVAGCEQYNIEYFVKKGGAVSSDSPEELTDQCIRLLQSERKLKEMEKALREYRRAEGARQIFEAMELLNTAKIYWKDTAYVERESDRLPQVPAGQIKYTRV